MKIYIAGKISSYRWKKYLHRVDLFCKKEKELKALGHKVYNPIKMFEQGKSWNWYMVRINEFLIKERPVCYFLKNWKKSRGARFEHKMAEYLKLKIVYE